MPVYNEYSGPDFQIALVSRQIANENLSRGVVVPEEFIYDGYAGDWRKEYDATQGKYALLKRLKALHPDSTLSIAEKDDLLLSSFNEQIRQTQNNPDTTQWEGAQRALQLQLDADYATVRRNASKNKILTTPNDLPAATFTAQLPVQLPFLAAQYDPSKLPASTPSLTTQPAPIKPVESMVATPNVLAQLYTPGTHPLNSGTIANESLTNKTVVGATGPVRTNPDSTIPALGVATLSATIPSCGALGGEPWIAMVVVVGLVAGWLYGYARKGGFSLWR